MLAMRKRDALGSTTSTLHCRIMRSGTKTRTAARSFVPPLLPLTLPSHLPKPTQHHTPQLGSSITNTPPPTVPAHLPAPALRAANHLPDAPLDPTRAPYTSQAGPPRAGQRAPAPGPRDKRLHARRVDKLGQAAPRSAGAARDAAGHGAGAVRRGDEADGAAYVAEG